MRNKKLMSRQKEIIQILTKSTVTNPITVSAIADKLNLSSRTVLREIPKIEEWLYENGFEFIKKPGVGLVINESLENQQLILELLEVENIQKEYTKEERKRIILGELLVSKEPLKLFYFTSQLKVSEGTLSNDLDGVEEYIKNFNIKLIRRQGLGIYLEGEEENYRKALADVIYSTLEEKEMINLIKESMGTSKIDNSIEFSIENRLLKFIDKSIIRDIEKILSSVEKQFEFKLADSAYIGLVVHLSLAIQRIKNGEKIIMDKDSLRELESSPEFIMAKKIGQSLQEELGVKLPKDELGYITMHLKGAKLRLNKVQDDLDLENLDIKQVANYMISEVESYFNLKIINKNKLRKDLSNHLVPAVSRLTMKLNIRNPLLDNIKEQYADVFNACEKACEILKKITNIDQVPESEVAYIAMHMAAALEENIRRKNLSVVIACPTGIGTSRLLAANVKKEFDNLDIKNVISAININTEKLKEQGIDFIISTVDLSVDYKYICVNPIFLEKDRILLKNFIHKMSKEKIYSRLTKKETKCDKDKMKHITELGSGILHLLDEFKINENDNVNSISELIKIASEVFAKSKDEAKSIENSLIEREAISSTYLSGLNMMLLHCKTEKIATAKYGIIRLNNKLIENEKEIDLAVVSLIPKDNTQAQIDIMSHLSGEIIERNDFRDLMKKATKEEFENVLEETLGELYRRELKKIMEE